MDKQPFDHIEDRFRQAAENLSAPFNEDAWNKMEELLDKDQGKKRRPVIWWWFALVAGLLLGTGVYYFGYIKRDHLEAGADRKINGPTKPLARQDTADEVPMAAKADQSGTGNSQPPSSSAYTGTHLNQASSISGYRTGRNALAFRTATGRKRSNRTKRDDASTSAGYTLDDAQRPPVGTGESTNIARDNSNPEAVVGDSMSGQTADNIGKKESVTAADSTRTERTATAKQDSMAKSSLKKETKAIKNERGLYIILNGGLDAVSLRKFTLHTYQPVYGGSIGYRFNNRWSLQAGFYTGKKLYTAGPNDYTVKAGSYIAKIISAEADCLIYDLPINLRFDVLTGKRHNVFVTTGVSSYILKRETYDMHFYNASNMYRRMAYTYKGNTNLFAVYNLSVGYEQKISRHFSVLAEPYLKLPLSGVGEGSVRLYSAGLQAGFKYQPSFRKLPK